MHDSRWLYGIVGLTLVAMSNPICQPAHSAPGTPETPRLLATSVPFGDVGRGELRPLFPSDVDAPRASSRPTHKARLRGGRWDAPLHDPVPGARMVRGERVKVRGRIWVYRDDVWTGLDAPRPLSDLVEALGALWAVDDEGQVWRADALEGPWKKVAPLQQSTLPARWQETERVTPTSRPAVALGSVGQKLLAVALDGTTWETADGASWTVHPQQLELPWARPFSVGGETYLDARVLHVWSDDRWVPVGYRDMGTTFARDDHRVYVAKSADFSDRTRVAEAFEGTRRVRFTTDAETVSDGSRLLVSGRKVGPWFSQEDGSALVLRGEDTSISRFAQWLHLTPDGHETVLLEGGRPMTGPWPLHASPEGVIAMGGEFGTLVWDRHQTEAPTRFPLVGDEVVAVHGGAYLQVGDRVHWLDLSDGEAREVHRTSTKEAVLVAANPGHLWLLRWKGSRLEHVDLGLAKTERLKNGPVSPFTSSLWIGSEVLGWLEEVRTDKKTRYAQRTVPLQGGPVTLVGETNARALLEHRGRLVRLSRTKVEHSDRYLPLRHALLAGDEVLGHVYAWLPLGKYVLFGDWLVRTDAGIVAVPVDWGATARPWP